MTFKEVLTQVVDWLQQDGRVSYRALKRQFDLDDDFLDDLKVELIKAKKWVADEDEEVLVWTGDAPTPSPNPRSETDSESWFQAMLLAVIGLLQVRRQATYRTSKRCYQV